MPANCILGPLLFVISVIEKTFITDTLILQITSVDHVSKIIVQ